MSHSLSYESVSRDVCEFLRKRSLSPNIAWVFADDLAWVNRRLKVHAPIRMEDESAARAIVESKAAQEFGIEVRAIGKAAEMTLCGIFVPGNQREAEELRIVGFKISIPEHLPEASEVRGTLKWMLARMRHREPSPFSELPRRGCRPK